MKKRVIWILAIGTIITILFFAGREFIELKVNGAFHDGLKELQAQGIQITYDSIDINLWRGSISAKKLQVKIGTDTALLAVKGSAEELIIKGVQMMPLLLNRSLSIESINLYTPEFVYSKENKWAGLKKSSNMSNKRLTHISVAHIQIENASVLFNDSIPGDTILNSKMTITGSNLVVDKEQDSLVVRHGDITITSAYLKATKTLYGFEAQKLHFSLDRHFLQLDSAKVIPLFERDHFMRKSGEQTSRIEALISRLTIEDFYLFHDSSKLHLYTGNSELNFKIRVYRDKRYPFLKKSIAEMPIEFLQKLPIHLKADTLKVKDSYVWYEEFPEKGESIGYVYFDHLNATISHLHNIPSNKKSENTHMKTTALFMGKGELDASFLFPADTMQPYETTGTLKHFPLSKVNSILEPSFQTRIESGVMSDFRFNFVYNKVRSDGSVELNYDDLKIISMKKDKDNHKIVSKFKTAVINLFVLKRNSEETERGDKKKGTILYYRDPHRAIFHFWWKSLFSGLVTAYKLDGLVPDLKDHGKEISKEIKSKAVK